MHLPDSSDPRLVACSVSALGDGPAGRPLGAVEAEAASSCCLDADNAPAVTGEQHGGQGSAPRNQGRRDGWGEGDGGEGEGEPTGSDGYWTELPPGIYSLDLSGEGQQLSLANGDSLRSSGIAGGAECQQLREEEGEQVAGQQADSAMGVVLGGRRLPLVHHPWRDELLLQLQNYRRARDQPDGVLPTPHGERTPLQQARQAPAELCPQQEDAGSGGQGGDCGSSGAAKGQARDGGDAEGGEKQADGRLAAGEGVEALCRELGCGHGAGDAAALALLNVLLVGG